MLVKGGVGSMEYRELNEEYQPSLLGFGCMRFPLDAQGKILSLIHI